ncbi:T9SS type A sorting domain-containing protein [bacterium]|nr:T9SS type A sorting domain-containing protein [bacterium]
MIKEIITLFCVSSSLFTFGQFAGPPGTSSTTAMYKDSSAFVNWASNAQLELGLIDISNGFSGIASSGDATSPTGFPDGSCISLGDSGVAILTFPQPITNESGPDFAVFENGFSDQFLELAFVEVSSDGVNFTRFPAISNTPTETQIGPFDALGDATLLNNLAGKYKVNYGTPFDLEELVGTIGLNISAITHVKIIDVVGMVNGNHVQLDSNGNPINDPYATAFPQCGFDLDAIGVIHQGPLGINESDNISIQVYPNPVQTGGIISVTTEVAIENMVLISFAGEIILESSTNTLRLQNCPSGIYLLKIQTEGFTRLSKIVVQ